MRNFSHFPVVLSKHGFAYYISPVYFIALFSGRICQIIAPKIKKPPDIVPAASFIKN